MKKLNNLETQLDIEPLPPIVIKQIEIEFDDDIHQDIFEDYKIVRTRLMNSIAIGETVLEEAVHDLRNNLSARTIEACAAILKTIGDQTDKVLNLHEKMVKLVPREEKEVEQADKKETIKTNINDILDQC